MIDLKLNRDWDLDINALGDVSSTSSIAQAVVIRLKWFFQDPTRAFPTMRRSSSKTQAF